MGPQMVPKNVKKSKKARSKTEIIPKRVQDASQGGLGEVLGGVWGEFWEDPGGFWVDLELVLELLELQKAVQSNKKKLELQKAATRNKHAEEGPREEGMCS